MTAQEKATPGPKRPVSYDFETHYEICQVCTVQIKWRSLRIHTSGTVRHDPSPMMPKRFWRCVDCAAMEWANRTNH